MSNFSPPSMTSCALAGPSNFSKRNRKYPTPAPVLAEQRKESTERTQAHRTWAKHTSKQMAGLMANVRTMNAYHNECRNICQNMRRENFARLLQRMCQNDQERASEHMSGGWPAQVGRTHEMMNACWRKFNLRRLTRARCVGRRSQEERQLRARIIGH